MKKKILLNLLVLVLVLGLTVGCSNEGTDNEDSGEKVFIARLVGDPMSFNPDMQADDNAYPIVQNIYNRLVKLDSSKQIIPDLATDWEVTNEGKKITFNLRSDANWTDGEPVTSEDVKYTFESIKEDKTNYFSSRLSIIDSIEIPDEYTVVFNMKEADVSFIADLGWYATFILPEHIFNNGQSWGENEATMKPIGSGPFMLSEYKQGESVTLVPNKDYHEGSPKIDRLVFSIIPDDATAVQALITGQIDFMEAVPSANVEELKANSAVRLKLNEYPSPMKIVFNLNAEEVQDVNIRRAIATAINREEISQKIFDGIQPPEYNMYPSLIEWASNNEDTAPKFNIQKAQNILEEAGYEKDSDGYYIRGLTIDVFEGYGYPDTAKLIEASLKKAGIEILVQVHEFNAWNEKVDVNRDFILEMQGGFMGPDPAALNKRFGSESGSNMSSYKNFEFDQLMMKGISTGNQDERAEIYKEAQAMLAKDLPCIPLVSYAVYDANNSNWINLPIDGAGKWGWAEYTFTDFK